MNGSHCYQLRFHCSFRMIWWCDGYTANTSHFTSVNNAHVAIVMDCFYSGVLTYIKNISYSSLSFHIFRTIATHPLNFRSAGIMSSWRRKQSTKATTTWTSFCCTGWRLPSEIVFRWMKLMMRVLWTLWRSRPRLFCLHAKRYKQSKSAWYTWSLESCQLILSVLNTSWSVQRNQSSMNIQRKCDKKAQW